MSQTAPPAATETLPELARRLAEALQNPNEVQVGEFAHLLERLNGELTLMKDQQATLESAETEADADWLAMLEALPATGEVDQRDVDCLARLLTGG